MSFKKIFSDGTIKQNPILTQSLGVCSALAVTIKLEPSFVMGVSVTIIAALASFIISLLRKTIPGRIRIIVQLVVIATLVIIVDQILKAFVYDVSKQLSVFVGLIITNCILMGRLEAFAMGNKPLPSLVDGFSNGAGYGMLLVFVGFIRELFGFGTLFDQPVLLPLGYEANSFMVMPPSALIIFGLIIWWHRSVNKQLIEN